METTRHTPDATSKELASVTDLAAARRRIGGAALTPDNFKDFLRQRRQETRPNYLAPVTPLDDYRQYQPTEEEALLMSTLRLQLATLKNTDDPNGVLSAANQTLEALFSQDPEEEVHQEADKAAPGIDKRPLAATLLYRITQDPRCTENYAKLAVGYPELLKLIGVAATLDPEDRHPAVRTTRQRALKVLSLLPGGYDFDTGEYTPPPENR